MIRTGLFEVYYAINVQLGRLYDVGGEGLGFSVQSTFREVEGSGAPVGAPQQPIFADAVPDPEL